MVYAHGLGPCEETREGSSPSPSIFFYNRSDLMSIFSKAQQGEVEVKELKKEGCKITLKVDAAASLVDKCFNDALVQVQSRAQMHGFRAGKVPLSLVKQNFPQHIMDRAVDAVIKSAVSKALEAQNLNPVAVPTLMKADFSKLAEGKPFDFEVAVEVAPEVNPVNYTGIKVTKKAAAVTDEEVDEQLRQVLEHNSRLEEDADAVVKDDSMVIVKYTGSKNGVADHKLSADSELVDISAPQTVDGLAEAVKGLKKGESKKFETKSGEDTLSYDVTVEEVKKKVLPALDDAFAKDMGFETVAELKEKVRENMSADAQKASDRDFVAQIEDALVKENNFPLPEGLVLEQTERSVDSFLQRFGGASGGITPKQRQELGEKMRPNVEKDIRIGYLVHAIAKKENLEATDADFDAELEKALKENDKKEEKRIKSFFAERKSHILATLNERKVFDFLKAKADVK